MAEKARGIGNGLFGIILGVIETIFASFIISFATYWSVMTSSINNQYNPSYVSGMYGVIGSLITFGGIYVLLHGIKRIVDNAFTVYAAGSKLQVIRAPPTLTRYCRFCGTENKSDATFCAKCGKQID